MLKLGLSHRPRVSRVTGRRAPVEYSDAVEKWARAHGGHAKLKWLEHPMNCWAVILSYRVGDPRQMTDSDGEPVLLHEYWTAEQWQKRRPDRVRRHRVTNVVLPGNYAFDLDELGVEGILQRLDRGNILSGRGEFSSVQDAADSSRRKHENAMEKMRSDKVENAGYRARDKRRSLLKIPFLPVGIDINRKEQSET